VNKESAAMMCSDILKLTRFGKTELNRPTLPRDDGCALNHCAIGTMTLSHGYCGIILPRPKSWALSSNRDSGYRLKMRPPLMPPPITKWFPAQPWSVPMPFEVSVRPKSEAVTSTTESKMFCPRISFTKSSRAELR